MWNLIYAHDANGVPDKDVKPKGYLIEKIFDGCPVRVLFDVDAAEPLGEKRAFSINCDPVHVRFGEVFGQASMVASQFVGGNHETFQFDGSRKVLHFNFSTTGKSHVRYQSPDGTVTDTPSTHALKWYVEE